MKELNNYSSTISSTQQLPHSVFQRLLYYSPHTMGIGHESRAISLLTAMRRYLGDMEYLVISSISVPERFLRHNIEVIRLPALQGFPSATEIQLSPRYLNNSTLAEVQQLRVSILNSVFDNYRPDLIFVDHHPLGLNGEIASWLIRKNYARDQFSLAYISRGLIANSIFIQPPYLRPQRGIDVIDVMNIYDRVYILDRQDRLDQDTLQSYTTSGYADRVRFLDVITVKTRDELLSKTQLFQLYQLPPLGLITANVGHNALKIGLLEKIVRGFELFNTKAQYSLLVVLSPYLDVETCMQVQATYSSRQVIVRSFTPDLIDLLNVSEAAICRAGYNTIAELLLTGCPALVVPEDYGSDEQSIRSSMLTEPTIQVYAPEVITPGLVASSLEQLLQLPRRTPWLINKYQVAERLISDLITMRERGNG